MPCLGDKMLTKYNASKPIESQPKGKFRPECVVNFAQLRRVLQLRQVTSNCLLHHRTDWPEWPGLPTFTGLLSQTLRSLIFLSDVSHFPGHFSAHTNFLLIQTYDAGREFRMLSLPTTDSGLFHVVAFPFLGLKHFSCQSVPWNWTASEQQSARSFSARFGSERSNSNFDLMQKLRIYAIERRMTATDFSSIWLEKYWGWNKVSKWQ